MKINVTNTKFDKSDIIEVKLLCSLLNILQLHMFKDKEIIIRDFCF